jgi:hypothetical protein
MAQRDYPAKTSETNALTGDNSETGLSAASASPSGSHPSRSQEDVLELDPSRIKRLVRAAVHVAGAETDAPNYEAFAMELQDAVKPFEHLVAPPLVGDVVQYFNPSYAPDDNEGVGVGPYSATVLKAFFDELDRKLVMDYGWGFLSGCLFKSPRRTGVRVLLTCGAFSGMPVHDGFL